MEAMIRVRMSQADAHYGGNLVAGGRLMELYGDVATELMIRHDGDEGLFVAYELVEFKAPVYAGDYLEVIGKLVSAGRTSRKIEFQAFKVIESRHTEGDSAAVELDHPILVSRAIGTCVVPLEKQRKKFIG
ncbi:3-aminobutyryl-CoA ammonia lyase [Clostridiales bacterium PH28_bin88]|nr:3-aminobutyryl-CoA ammonia lyase [Clostridiales bacterium PH28_bin88]